MNTRLFHYIITVFLLLSTLGACGKEDRKLLLTQQEANIDKFVATLQEQCDTVYYSNGTVRVVLQPGRPEGHTLEAGDSLAIYYAGYQFSSNRGALFTTNQDSVATANNFYIPEENRGVYGAHIGQDYFIKGLEYGMLGMLEGEHAFILFNAQLGFGNSPLGILPPMSALLYEIWMERIIKK